MFVSYTSAFTHVLFVPHQLQTGCTVFPKFRFDLTCESTLHSCFSAVYDYKFMMSALVGWHQDKQQITSHQKHVITYYYLKIPAAESRDYIGHINPLQTGKWSALTHTVVHFNGLLGWTQVLPNTLTGCTEMRIDFFMLPRSCTYIQTFLARIRENRFDMCTCHLGSAMPKCPYSGSYII